MDDRFYGNFFLENIISSAFTKPNIIHIKFLFVKQEI